MIARYELDASALPPLVTWGTSPEQVTSITGSIPRPDEIANEQKRAAARRSLAYMGLNGGEKVTDIKIDRVFIGSCVNARIEDLREAARVVEGRTVNSKVSAMVVPGSGLVKRQAEAEGLDKVFLKAGFDWREPGCSMCLAMNADRLGPGERCASTSNRNFEGRQGYKGRTHLVSPAMAAAAAVAGKSVDVRQWSETCLRSLNLRPVWLGYARSDLGVPMAALIRTSGSVRGFRACSDGPRVSALYM